PLLAQRRFCGHGHGWLPAGVPTKCRLGKSPGPVRQERRGAAVDGWGAGAAAGRIVVVMGGRAGHGQRTRPAAAVAAEFAARHAAGGRRLLPGLRLVHRPVAGQGVVPGAAVEQVATVHRDAAATGAFSRRAGLVLAGEGPKPAAAAVAVATAP